MATISHGPAAPVERRSRHFWDVMQPPAWAAIAIASMWIAVLVDAIWGPDIVSNNSTPGTNNGTTVPSVVAVALFAAVATIAIARRAFGPRD